MIVLHLVRDADLIAIAKTVLTKKTMRRGNKQWMLFWTEILMPSSLKSKRRKASTPRDVTVKNLDALRSIVNATKAVWHALTFAFVTDAKIVKTE